MRHIWNRIYADFLMPPRLSEYQVLLERALQMKNNICSIEEFWRIYQANEFKADSIYLILRHDIDTDVATAKDIFKIERSFGIRASYYFRLSTLDIRFMNDLHNYGSEASYHYEEIASYAKINKIREPQQIYSNMKKIQDLFADNLGKLRKITGLSMSIVASHGDFVNRFLQISNTELLQDKELINEQGIEHEVYDEKMMYLVTSRHSDTAYPYYWKPNSPLQALEEESKVVYLLTHPRYWQVNTLVNLKDNLGRIKEGIKYMQI